MVDPVTGIAIAAAAGVIGGSMNALAGGGTFVTLPALIALGLPANTANATSNVALLPGACTSAFVFRDEIGPVGGVDVRLLAAITFAAGLAGGLALVLTPTRVFDVLIPWLLLFAFVVMLLGPRASQWLRGHVTIGPRSLVASQALLGIYGGYFGGGVGLMTTALYGLLAGLSPRAMFAPRTVMLAVANLAAALIFIGFGMVRWLPCIAMLTGAIIGGWLGAHIGKRLPPRGVRLWTLGVTGFTTLVFFLRVYS